MITAHRHKNAQNPEHFGPQQGSVMTEILELKSLMNLDHLLKIDR
jgi:hypothetical protein